ncbi:MAG: hypothetical protein A2X94_16380 [Bdellovibrionales bacterium GWB1_55_8]|nr:MAG: hypothetical protein A2X94_16380 [Bdellovibrionales bacterium GWB1_55_8]
MERTQRDRVELVWADSMAAQARALADGLLGNIRSVKNALELLQSVSDTAGTAAAPAGGIVHWAELVWPTGGGDAGNLWGVPRILRSARNIQYQKDFSEPMEKSYLGGVLRKLDRRRFQNPQGPFEVLRYRRDPLQPVEWLVLAFSSGSHSVLVALVDPARAFSAFDTPDAARRTSRIRRYVLGNDGRVLAHSHSPYIGADFDGSGVFGKLQSRLEKETSSHSSEGVFSDLLSLDQQKVRGAFVRPAGLPLITVVERTMEDKPPFDWRRVLGSGLIALGVLASLIAMGTVLLTKFKESRK